MEENHHAGTQCRCWKKSQVLIQMEAQNSLLKTSLDPLFLQEKHPQSTRKNPPPSQICEKYLKDLYSDTVFRGMTPKKLGQITTPTAMRVTGSCGASDKTNQMTRPKQPIFVRSKWDVPKGLSDPVFVGFFSPLISKMSACIFSTPTTMGRFSGK